MSTQSLPDKVLWILNTNTQKMKRSELRRRVKVKMYELVPVLEDLEREGKIKIDSKDIISLV